MDGAGNVISGNRLNGIFIQSDGANTQILGNFIGTGSDGMRNIGNANAGVHVEGFGNRIGGIEETESNVTCRFEPTGMPKNV